MRTSHESNKFIRIYLEDHIAGATAGARRAARLALAESESADAGTLATFAEDVSSDREALLAIAKALGVEPSRWKDDAAWVGEKLAALKLNGHVLERSPLSIVVELEAMQMAVRGKRSLWETLRLTVPGATPIDLDGLIGRADSQLDELSRLHAARVVDTFAPQST